MMNRLVLCSAVSLTAMLLCGCGSEPTTFDATSVTADGQVTFLVKGMIERLSIY